MEKKKVAIVTVYNACNYGSFLQAYALQEFIRESGYETSFVCLEVAEEKIIGADRQSAEYSEYEKIKYQKIVENQKKFPITDVVDETYECAVLGSDTIWNMFDPVYASIPYFVGKGLKSKKVISYAASVGQSRLIKILLLRWRQLLPIRRLDNFSVRDDKTEKLLKIYGKKAIRVLDPTFLIDFKTMKPMHNITEKYLLVYTYGFSDEQIDAVKTYANQKKLKIVATGSLCEWADINLAVDSFEWLWLVEHAVAVVTSTFHGTVFSIKYNKPFAVLTNHSDKIVSLLKEVDLSNHLCAPSQLQSVLDKSISYDEINAVINIKIQRSKKYLLENLEENKNANISG